MDKRVFIAAVGATISTTALSILRIGTVADAVQKSGGTYNILWLCLTAALLLALLFCGRTTRNTVPELNPLAVKAVGIGAVVVGCSMAISAVASLVTWLADGQLPYPVNDPFRTSDVVLFYLFTALGVAAAVVMLFVGIRTILGGRLPIGTFRFSTLLPVFWMWIRIARYEISYVSSLQTARHWQDLLMLVTQLLFWMAFARLLSGASEKPPRLFAGTALCAGTTAAVACIARVFAAPIDAETATSVYGLITASDLGVAVLAFALAFGWLSAACEQPSEPTVTENDDSHSDPDDELYDIHDTARQPLELEDVINDIIQSINNGEK